MVPISPTVAQWELSLRLRKRRKELGMDVKTITDTMGFTRNYWSIVENDRRILTEEHLRKVCELFELDADERDELLSLRAKAKERSRWSRYTMLDDAAARLFGMEQGCSQVRVYEGGLITGLLQTEAYARALHVSNVFIRKADTEQFVEVRMRRQERLFGPDPIQLSMIISEGALQQQVGGPEIQRDQLRHLVKVGREHENVDIRVLPFAASGAGIVGSATFYLLDFESSHLPMLGWTETANYFGFIDSYQHVRDLNVIYGQALAETLSREDSLVTIEKMADRLS